MVMLNIHATDELTQYTQQEDEMTDAYPFNYWVVDKTDPDFRKHFALGFAHSLDTARNIKSRWPDPKIVIVNERGEEVV